MHSVKWMYLTSLTVVVVVLVVSFQCLKLPSKSLESRYSTLEELTRLIEDEHSVDLPLHLMTKSAVTLSKVKEEPNEEGSLTLPFPKTTLSVKKILQQQWVGDLKEILAEISPGSPPVHIIAGNYEYREVLLNWLISAKVRVNPPLRNIIVLSIDSPLCDLLNKRNITCVYAHWKEYLVKELPSPFAAILVLRITVIRLLNYWGYDAANIDTDALILKNPEPLYQKFNESDLLASRSRAPPALARKWGVTICAGVFMVRSTQNSGA